MSPCDERMTTPPPHLPTPKSNGSIITMTLKNNHLIVETEETAVSKGLLLCLGRTKAQTDLEFLMIFTEHSHDPQNWIQRYDDKIRYSCRTWFQNRNNFPFRFGKISWKIQQNDVVQRPPWCSHPQPPSRSSWRRNKQDERSDRCVGKSLHFLL